MHWCFKSINSGFAIDIVPYLDCLKFKNWQPKKIHDRPKDTQDKIVRGHLQRIYLILWMVVLRNISHVVDCWSEEYIWCCRRRVWGIYLMLKKAGLRNISHAVDRGSEKYNSYCRGCFNISYRIIWMVGLRKISNIVDGGCREYISCCR